MRNGKSGERRPKSSLAEKLVELVMGSDPDPGNYVSVAFPDCAVLSADAD
jgi:hypothetical protein